MKKLILAVSVLFCSSNTLAAAIVCTGQVSSLALNPTNGIVQANIGFGFWYLCSVSTSINGVPTEVCKTWYSTLLANQATGRPYSMYFDNGTALQCSQLGNWAVPNPMPYYVVTEK